MTSFTACWYYWLGNMLCVCVLCATHVLFLMAAQPPTGTCGKRQAIMFVWLQMRATFLLSFSYCHIILCILRFSFSNTCRFSTSLLYFCNVWVCGVARSWSCVTGRSGLCTETLYCSSALCVYCIRRQCGLLVASVPHMTAQNGGWADCMHMLYEGRPSLAPLYAAA